jgi:hypothetical protein
MSADLVSEKRPGRPRQQMEGSRRRQPRDAGAEVGESPWGRQKKKILFVNAERIFLFTVRMNSKRKAECCRFQFDPEVVSFHYSPNLDS